jgi:hypothetical protein
MALQPAISIPYLAKPRAQLEGLSFSNSFTNVDAASLDNNTVKLVYYESTPGTGADSAYKTLDLSIDDGYYSLADGIGSLEAALAKKLEAAATTTSYSYEKHTETLGSSLWDTMNVYAGASPGYDENDPSTANTVFFDSPATIVTGSGVGSDLINGTVAAGKMILPVKASTLELWRKTQANAPSNVSQPPEWLIGAKLKAATYTNLHTKVTTDQMTPMKLTADARIVAIHQLVKNAEMSGSGGSDVELDAEWGVELSAHGSGAVTSLVEISGDGLVAMRVSFEPTGGNNGNYRGYGTKGLARPSLDADSGWGSALLPQEMENITKATGPSANNIVVSTGALQGEQQWQRFVKPFTFQVDGSTNKLKFYTGWPGLYVCKGSTLFTKMLGFDDDQFVTQSAPVQHEMAKQNPFCNDTVLIPVAAPGDRTMLHSQNEIKVTRVRALCLNCPTLVPASYGTDGKLSLAQMSSMVPVVVGQNEIQTFQAQYDNSVPCDIHGVSVDEIEFYLTDQDGNSINLQKSTFQATLRLFYDDPIHPKIGEAGAEMDSTIGLRDILFR